MPTADQPGPPYVSIHGMVSINGYGQGGVDGGSSNDITNTSPDRPSNGPTPNSSTASEQQKHTLAPTARINSSGGNSFEASPASPNGNLNNLGAPTTQGEVAAQGVNGFFGGPASFGMAPGVGSGLPPDQRFSMPAAGGGGGEFAVPPGWADMSGQTGMTPVPEGVFRSILSMGPMDTMDLAWDTNP